MRTFSRHMHCPRHASVHHPSFPHYTLVLENHLMTIT